MRQDWPAFRDVPYMGVIQVVAEAAKLGFTNGDADWCNLGQGQPEVGPLEGAPARLQQVDLEPIDLAYGPVGGMAKLRDAVASHYNRLFRHDKRSQYSAANVAIAAGGRLALSRLLATLAPVRIGYQAPDYTAYEDMLASQSHRIAPVLLRTTVEDAFKVTPKRLAREIRDHRLGAYLVSNPCNPTGQLVAEQELQDWVAVGRESGCAILLDEFYSHFIYRADGSPGDGPVSSAAYIDDIERDPVVIIDGLTKNYRYPGLRVGWIVGPSSIIEQVTRAASAIDGGPPNGSQRAALQILEPQRADQETHAVRKAFACKRSLMLDALTSLGVRVPHSPLGTFYIWGDISRLRAPYNDAEALLRAALRERVMVVPGRYFDVNPAGARAPDPQYQHWVRFSFGPPEDNVRLGLDRLRRLLT
jgi:aspartate/methionine/tyrosine aminotransferase